MISSHSSPPTPLLCNRVLSRQVRSPSSLTVTVFSSRWILLQPDSELDCADPAIRCLCGFLVIGLNYAQAYTGVSQVGIWFALFADNPQINVHRPHLRFRPHTTLRKTILDKALQAKQNGNERDNAMQWNVVEELQTTLKEKPTVAKMPSGPAESTPKPMQMYIQ